MVACETSRRHPPEALRCPRCDSSDTKFCYFNNYNTSQPRHFCKSCKRYWTAGGSLRNVPVGGGLRKNRKSKLLNQVKDMVSSSSSDELFQGSSLAPNPPFAFAHEGMGYEVPRPLSFTPPLYVASPSSSADVASDGSLANTYAYRNLNPVNYGYYTENRADDYAIAGMDPSLVNSMNVRQQAHFQGNYGRVLPEGIHRPLNGVSYGPNSLAGPDQGQSYNGGVSEVPREQSQASSKGVHTSQSADLNVRHVDKGLVSGEELTKIDREESAEASVVTRQQSVCELDKIPKQEIVSVSDEPRYMEDSQLRDISSTEGEDDELGNVVNVRYPYDWEQVSEVLFGGTPDFLQLSGY